MTETRGLEMTLRAAPDRVVRDSSALLAHRGLGLSTDEADRLSEGRMRSPSRIQPRTRGAHACGPQSSPGPTTRMHDSRGGQGIGERQAEERVGVSSGGGQHELPAGWSGLGMELDQPHLLEDGLDAPPRMHIECTSRSRHRGQSPSTAACRLATCARRVSTA